jgi:hypothetical protein
MGEIHELAPRQCKQRGTLPPGPAEIIIFPGVRVERGDYSAGDGKKPDSLAARGRAPRAVLSED